MSTGRADAAHTGESTGHGSRVSPGQVGGPGESSESDRGGNRRGATIIVAAGLISVLMMFLAFVIDISQMYVVRTEMHVSADAAALAGTIQLAHRRDDSAALMSTNYGAVNLVRGQPTFNSVQYGRWSTFSSSFSPFGCGAVCDTSITHQATAMRVTVQASGAPVFAQFAQSTIGNFSMADTTVAWLSNRVSETDCVRPWAMPYTLLTSILGPPGGSTRTLTRTDIRHLNSKSIQQLTVSLKASFQPGAANSYTPLAYPTGSLPEYRTNVSAPNVTGGGLFCPTSGTIGPSSFISALDPLAGFTRQDVDTATALGAAVLCTPLAGNGACYNSLGVVGVPVKVVFWDSYFPGGCGTAMPCTIVPRIIGGFSIDSVTDTTLVGHFIKLIDSGGTIDTNVRSTLMRPVIVR
jgi:Flp pilus assembly protein TadG